MPMVSTNFLKNINIDVDKISINELNKKLNTGEQLKKPEILFKKYE